MVQLTPVALFFLLFALPSALLALLALRDFVLRAQGPPGARVRRAVVLFLAASALPAALVALTVALTAAAPLASPSGWGFLAYGALAPALGLAGAWLLPRAAGSGRRRWVKAAETLPLVLVMMDLSLMANVLRG